jgi:hypothetical protein
MIRVKLGLLNLFKNRLINNKRGVSIIQVLMAAGMTSIVSLGVVQMIENSRRMQRRTTLMSALNDVKARLETNMRDQIAFQNTVNGNGIPPWSQMAAQSNVTETTLSTPSQFVLFDAGGRSWNLLGVAASDSTSTRYNGFTEKGGDCSDFNPVLGYGSDNCPISYRLLVVADCSSPGATSCRDPNLLMVARLVFNPASTSSSTMNTWRGLIPQAAGSSLITPSEKYDAEVRRSASKVNKGFFLSASVSPTGAVVLCDTGASSQTNTGGGTCNSSGWSRHPIQHVRTHSAGWQEESDAHSLVNVFPSTGFIQFTETGFYRCTIVAKAFSTNLTIRMVNVSSTGVVSGSGTVILGTYSEGEARMDVTFNVTNKEHAYTIEQRCSSAAMNSCTLGFAKDGYAAPERILTMSCDRWDVMM